MPNATPRTPPDLGKVGGKFWRETVSEFDLEPTQLARLKVACDLLDTIASCRSLIASEGAIVKTPHGPKAHPAAIQLRDSQVNLLRALKAMGLDEMLVPMEPPKPVTKRMRG